jgi:hypothetical protein
VRRVTVERFIDMAGVEYPTHAEAWKASIHGLLASRLADEGIPAPDAIAAAILEVFVLVPRREVG